MNAARLSPAMKAPAYFHALDLAGSFAVSALRGGLGILAEPAAQRPPALFELYEYEGCPYCRLVREALTELDLDAMIYPAPRGGERFRPRAEALGGKAQFPLFVDPNTGRQLYESGDIVRYLFATYAGRPLPMHWRTLELQKLGSGMAGLSRWAAGTRARPSRAPEAPLELYSFEASPYARPVRERLCELEIPYVLRSSGRRTAFDWVPPGLRDLFRIPARPGTLNRSVLLERAGRVSIPYLIDPNTGAGLAESADILAYLDETYAL